MVRKLPWRESRDGTPPKPRSAGTYQGANPSKRRRLDRDSDLCKECALLDLDKSFLEAHEFYESARTNPSPPLEDLWSVESGPLFYKDAFLVHHFNERLARWSQCPLCQFFRSMRVQPGQHERYKLLAFCSSDNALFCLPRLRRSPAWDEFEHSVFMAVVPDLETISADGHEEHWLERDVPTVGSIFLVDPKRPPQPNTLLLPREVKGRVDFSIARDWLSFCEEHHRGCNPGTTHEPIVQAFRVINCFKDPPAVEDHTWGVRYVALSYVWGKGPMDDWPRTVMDAVAVTKEMGLQYLWVDRLCINQASPAERDYLIARMTTIYDASHFTIVAAAGSGATHGLPGVGLTPRIVPPRIELQSGSLLITTSKDARREITESEYSTRGWTYQEGILSNRHLVFTDHQVYWECRCMAIPDGISIPLELAHSQSRHHMADFMLTGIFKRTSESAGVQAKGDMPIVDMDANHLVYGFRASRRVGSTIARLRGLDEHIRAFSARQLSHDEDSLTAFLGIAGMYKAEPRLSLIHGIPTWTGRIVGGRAGANVTFCLSVSAWYHRSGSIQEMFVIEPCRRRPHLPSWSWAGWEGTVSWRCPPNDEHAAFMGGLIEEDKVDMIWAADAYLWDVNMARETWLKAVSGPQELHADNAWFLEVKNPSILSCFNLHTFKKEWGWHRLAGRVGRAQFRAERMSWDSEWRRLAGRLVSINLSVSMTLEEWSEKHHSGEIVSVLMLAARIPSNRHGRARFLTLRRLPASPMGPASRQRWERVGMLQLIIAEQNLDEYKRLDVLLRKLPVHAGPEDLLVQ